MTCIPTVSSENTTIGSVKQPTVINIIWRGEEGANTFVPS
jgi:hypothetical protein